MNDFSRTDSGLKSKYLLYDEPVVWVEGRTDIYPIKKILDGLDYRMEVLGGKKKSKPLRKGILEEDLPYVVVLDGDYDILKISRSKDSKIVRLYRYSIENYLFEEEICIPVIENILRLSGDPENIPDDVDDEIRSLFKEFRSEIRRLKFVVIIDISDIREENGETVMPGHIAHFLDRDSLSIDMSEVSTHLNGLSKLPSTRTVESVMEEVEDFLSESDFTHLFKGELLLQSIREIMNFIIDKYSNDSLRAKNETLIYMLSQEIENVQSSSDHRSLKRRLRREVRDLQ